ncbi:hypothetical protein KSP39_PZI020601 [Platanthera zijinensis]|uniref:Uncharacterized protein n=1 Tax=Platanthera zijinensis TaxID=2320716 RepID=A0AAP0FXC8_9ASPA
MLVRNLPAVLCCRSPSLFIDRSVSKKRLNLLLNILRSKETVFLITQELLSKEVTVELKNQWNSLACKLQVLTIKKFFKEFSFVVLAFIFFMIGQEECVGADVICFL